MTQTLILILYVMTENAVQAEPQKLRVSLGREIALLEGCPTWPTQKKNKTLETHNILPTGNYEVTVLMPHQRKVTINTKQLDLVQNDGIVTAIVVVDSTRRDERDVLAEIRRRIAQFGIGEQDEVSRLLTVLTKNMRPIVVRGLLAQRALVGVSLKQHVALNGDLPKPKEWYLAISLNWVAEDDWKDLSEVDQKVWKELNVGK